MTQNFLNVCKDLATFHDNLVDAFDSYDQDSHPHIIGTFGGRSFKASHDKWKELDKRVSLKEIIFQFDKLTNSESDKSLCKKVFQIIRKLDALAEQELTNKANFFQKLLTYVRDFFSKLNKEQNLENIRQKTGIESVETYDFSVLSENESFEILSSKMPEKTRYILSYLYFNELHLPDELEQMQQRFIGTIRLGAIEYKPLNPIKWMLLSLEPYLSNTSSFIPSDELLEIMKKESKFVEFYNNHLDLDQLSKKWIDFFKPYEPNPQYQTILADKLKEKFDEGKLFDPFDISREINPF